MRHPRGPGGRLSPAPGGADNDKRTPELGRLGLHGHRITFRTTPPQLHAWLRRIDRWIAYANSVVEE